jgi:hypothetical protein
MTPVRVAYRDISQTVAPVNRHSGCEPCLETIKYKGGIRSSSIKCTVIRETSSTNLHATGTVVDQRIAFEEAKFAF